MNEIDPRYVDQIFYCDCVDGMRRLAAERIPLTVTSPPYGDLREYGRHPFDLAKFRHVADELYRVTMPGGVLVWVVQDQVVDGAESAASIRQFLYFLDLGFRLHNTLIMAKNAQRRPGNGRYAPAPEYAFVLSRGKPRTANVIADRVNRNAGQRLRTSRRLPDGSICARVFQDKVVRPLGQRGSVWVYDVGWDKTTRDKFAFDHPALMPEAMARDLILSYSRPGDLVFDPMCGAGTTCKMAILLNRRALGFEIVSATATLPGSGCGSPRKSAAKVRASTPYWGRS
jgi:site-specific DNA-methyltransferase (adenine-specific)